MQTLELEGKTLEQLAEQGWQREGIEMGHGHVEIHLLKQDSQQQIHKALVCISHKPQLDAWGRATAKTLTH